MTQAQGITNRLWELADGDWDDVFRAVERWHVEHDLAIPADAQFLNAVVLQRVGTSVDSAPHVVFAEQVRCVMPCGNVYVLTVDYDVDMPGDRWNNSVKVSASYYVESAEVVR